MKVDLSRTCETWIRIPDITRVDMQNKEGALLRCCEPYLGFLHSEVIPLIRQLKDREIIKWFCFLVHPLLHQLDGVPCVHIRMELADGVGIDELKRNLSDSYECTCPVCEAEMSVIPEGLEKEILKGCNSEEAWWVIGQGSEWIISMLEAHSPDKDVTLKQVRQFLHYIHNATLTWTIFEK